MSVTRRSLRIALVAAALGVPLAASGSASAQDVFGPCDLQQPQPVQCVKETPGNAVDTVRDICLVREGKYCLLTVGQVIDRTLPPLTR